MEKIVSWFLNKYGIVGQIVSILFKTAINKELGLALPIAMQVVADVKADTTIITSEEKRAISIAKITSKLIEGQTPIANSIINLAIELAYQKLRIV